MSLDIVALRRMVWLACGMQTDNDVELPRESIDLYLNRSFWEVQDKFPFREKEKTATFDTAEGVNRYDMPQPFESLKHLAIVGVDENNHIPLQRMTADVYEQSYDTDEDQYSMPTHYVREGCFVRFWPTPSAAFTIVIRRLITLDDLSNDNSIPVIPQVWHEIIGYGAAWRALLDFGDTARKQHFQATQAALINSLSPVEAKEEQANTQLSGLEVVRQAYGW